MSFKTLIAYKKYIQKDKRIELQSKSEEIGKFINYMMNNPDKFK